MKVIRLNKKQKAVFQLHISEYPIKDWIFRKEVRLKSKKLFFNYRSTNIQSKIGYSGKRLK
jgi:hypothetical protein